MDDENFLSLNDVGSNQNTLPSQSSSSMKKWYIIIISVLTVIIIGIILIIIFSKSSPENTTPSTKESYGEIIGIYDVETTE